MIHSNNHKNSGFIFIEVILTIFMVGMLGTSALTLQSEALNKIFLYWQRLTRSFMLETFLIEEKQAFQKKQEPIKQQTIQNPETMLSFAQEDVNPQSSLKTFKYLKMMKFKAQWKDKGTEKTESLVTIRYLPPDKSSDAQNEKKRE